VVKADSPGVQSLALEQRFARLIRMRRCCGTFDFVARDPCAATVKPVAQDRMTEAAQMNPKLVRSAGFWHDFQQRKTVKPRNDVIERLGLAARRMAPSDGHPLTLPRMVAERMPNDVLVPIGHADHDRIILLLDGPRGELAGEMSVRRIGPRDDHDAAGVAIEPVDNTRARRAADAAELVVAKDECRGERP
jgi:hypothetical protein